ncbi:MAG: ribonuclease III [Candidatus Cloacimonadota bacterium]|nr:MAG: ribonuclease III [Candidatus Cloacimonadota bacterium]
MKNFLKSLISYFSDKKPNPKVEGIQKKINYRFHNIELLYAALTHTSYESSGKSASPFERMEFLGDSILGLIVAEELFSKFPHFREGDLSKLKSKIVSRKFLKIKAKELHLADFLLLSKEAINDEEKNSTSILSDAMESLICAIYLDGGYEKAKKFIRRFVLENYEKEIKSNSLINYKSKLQEFVQSKYRITPFYKVTAEKGPEHDKTFYINVFVKGKLFGSGKGSNKKEAEQNAAKEACEKLNIF